MVLIKIDALYNKGHNYQIINRISRVPLGWAIVPDILETPNFPYGDLTAEEIDGVMTVTSWIPGEMPEPIPEQQSIPTVEEDIDSMLIDHEYRLILLELEVK